MRAAPFPPAAERGAAVRARGIDEQLGMEEARGVSTDGRAKRNKRELRPFSERPRGAAYLVLTS